MGDKKRENKNNNKKKKDRWTYGRVNTAGGASLGRPPRPYSIVGLRLQVCHAVHVHMPDSGWYYPDRMTEARLAGGRGRGASGCGDQGLRRRSPRERVREREAGWSRGMAQGWSAYGVRARVSVGARPEPGGRADAGWRELPSLRATRRLSQASYVVCRTGEVKRHLAVLSLAVQVDGGARCVCMELGRRPKLTCSFCW